MRALRRRFGRALTRGEKHARLVLGRIARNAKVRSLEGRLSKAEHGALWRLHTGLAEKYEKLGDAVRGRRHRDYAQGHLSGWLST